MPSKIEWTNETWNPIRARDLNSGKIGWHCEIVSPGCENCYAEAINHRLGTGDDYLKKSRRAEVFLDEKMLMLPLRWRRPRRIFVCSMSDLFGEWVTDGWLDRIFAVMGLCPQHTWQVLTKRAERMRDYCALGERPEAIARAAAKFDRGSSIRFRWPLPNVWLGVSVEDQRRADERIPLLLGTAAAVRWVSAEPLLGNVDFRALYHNKTITDALDGISEIGVVDAGDRMVAIDPKYRTHARLDWVVVGGKSGPGARPSNVEWARSIIAQCKAAGVPCFVKQLGAFPYQGLVGESAARVETMPPSINRIRLHDRKGGDPAEWPSDLRVREYPA